METRILDQVWTITQSVPSMHNLRALCLSMERIPVYLYAHRGDIVVYSDLPAWFFDIIDNDHTHIAFGKVLNKIGELSVMNFDLDIFYARIERTSNRMIDAEIRPASIGGDETWIIRIPEDAVMWGA